MRSSRLSLAALCLSLGATGCAGLLGLDDFTEGESGQAGTESSSSTESGGPGSGGGGTGTPTSSSTGNGGASSSGGGGEGGSTGPLDVTPGEAKVGILRGLQFEANQDVTWAVEEDDGGTIDESGYYVSPADPGEGTFHVVATSTADESITQRVEVTVVGLNAVVVGGIPGGSGNIDGTPRRARFSRPESIAGFDDDSTYIADTGNNTIREWDRQDGVVRTLAGMPGESGTEDGTGSEARFDGPTSIVVGARVWVVDSYNHCIRSIVKTTGEVTTLAGQCGVAGSVDAAMGGAVRFDTPQRAILSEDRDTIYVCETGGRAIRAVDTASGATTTIVENTSGYCEMGYDNWRRRVQFFDYFNGSYVIRGFPDPYDSDPITELTTLPDYIYGMTIMAGFGSLDELFVLRRIDDDDQSIFGVFKYNITDAEWDVDPWLGGQPGYLDGELIDARLADPSGLTGDPGRGLVYVLESDGAIRTADWYEEEVETILGPVPNLAPVDGNKSVARLPTPVGLTLGDGFAYESNFSDTDNTIRRIDLETGEVSTFAGTPGDGEGVEPVDGPPGEGSFGIASDVVYLDGELYVTDLFGAAVRRVDATGDIMTIAGSLGEPGFADGVGAAAQFRFADDGIGGGLATDGTDLYICDTGNFAIRKLDVSTGAVTTIAGGTQGSADGVGAAAQFVAPSGVTYYDGFLYITDFVDSTIRRLDLATNEVTTLTGRPGELGETDGGPGVATFTTPFRLVADGIGNLYVSEVQGSVIRRISLEDAQTTTFLGTSGMRGVNPAPFPTTLNCPAGLAVIERGGDLVFADACDGVIMQAKPL